MRAAWQIHNLCRMEKQEPTPLKKLIRAFFWGNELKAFPLLKSAIFAFPHERHLKPTTATTTWNSKQKPKSAVSCFFRRYFSEKPCISSLAALERHLKRNDRCDRKTQKKCRKRERQKGEETRTSLQFLEPQINLIQGYMTTNINITQTWWRLLSAVGSTLITLVAWLGYMALCMVGEVILGIVKFIFGIIISILSMVVLIGTFIWLLTL